MLPRCIACFGKDFLIGFIDHLYLDKYIFISVYLKFALAGYIVSMARILYVHIMGAIVLLPRTIAITIEIVPMARILHVHVIGRFMLARKYFACFVGGSCSSGFCIFNLLIHIFFLVIHTSDFKTVSSM